MKLEVLAKNYHVSERLNQILQSKIKKLDKYFPDSDTVAKVVMTDLGRQCKMELSINYYGTQLRSEVVGNTMYYNIDECLPKIERQIVKYREKLNSKKKSRHSTATITSRFGCRSGTRYDRKVKRSEIDTLTPIEAAENLEMVGHDFYLFNNVETGRVEAVYRRKDGTIGHLQPYQN